MTTTRHSLPLPFFGPTTALERTGIERGSADLTVAVARETIPATGRVGGGEMPRVCGSTRRGGDTLRGADTGRGRGAEAVKTGVS